MRKAGMILLATLMIAGTVTAELVSEPGHAPYYNSYEEGLKAAAAKGQPMAIKFFTDW